jgi:hypothetical protein
LPLVGHGPSHRHCHGFFVVSNLDLYQEFCFLRPISTPHLMFKGLKKSERSK